MPRVRRQKIVAVQEVQHRGAPQGNTVPGVPGPVAEEKKIEKIWNGKVRDWHFTFYPRPFKDTDCDVKDEFGFPVLTKDNHPRPRWDPETMVYLCFQLERGTKENHPHYQGCVYFPNVITRKTAQKRLGIGNAHIDPNNGTMEENRKYCTEEPKRYKGSKDLVGPFEFGELPQQGKRRDLRQITEEIVTTGVFDEQKLARENPTVFCYHRNGLRELAKVLIKKKVRAWQTRCIVHAGVTRAGKSYAVLKEYGIDPEKVCYIDLARRMWFDNYKGQPIVVWSEFAFTDPKNRWFPEREFCKLIDSTPYDGDVKCLQGGTPWIPELVVITTNDNPLDWPANMQRRITDTVIYTKQYADKEAEDRIAANMEKWKQLSLVLGEGGAKINTGCDTSLESLAAMQDYIPGTDPVSKRDLMGLMAEEKSPYVLSDKEVEAELTALGGDEKSPPNNKNLTDIEMENRMLKDDMNAMESELARLRKLVSTAKYIEQAEAGRFS